ncbi:hypothetical protein [Phreatobacter sp.]|uniref:hypothetical protein n=1 Tax=Phreatobacter sp. TaxID=1966341 RepID=UPI0025D21036|nr:hypothetical protein [Phreatobacter sp.]
MEQVRQHGAAAELSVAYLLRAGGVAYRLNVKSPSGSRDFPHNRRKRAIFANGCYWHHHKNCPRATIPKRTPNSGVPSSRATTSAMRRSLAL